MNILRIKIVTRIILAFSIVLVLSIGTLSFLVYKISTTKNKTKDLYGIYIITNYSNEIQQPFMEMNKKTKEAIIAAENEDGEELIFSLSQLKGYLNSKSGNISENLKIFKKWIKEESQKEWIAKKTHAVNC